MRPHNSRIAMKNFWSLFLLFAVTAAFAEGAKPPNQPNLIPVFTNVVGMRLVLIPAGEFFMGSRNDEAERSLAIMKQKHVDQWYQQSPTSEVPQHQVRISKSFYMGAYEV